VNVITRTASEGQSPGSRRDRAPDPAFRHRFARRRTADEGTEQGSQICRRHRRASDVHRHHGRQLPQRRHQPDVQRVVHAVDGTGHDQVRTQGRDVVGASRAAGQRHTQFVQHRADPIVGRDHATDRGR
jgi:hypothetical protein